MGIVVGGNGARGINEEDVADAPALRITGNDVEYTNSGVARLVSTRAGTAAVQLDGAGTTLVNYGGIAGFRAAGGATGIAILGSAGNDRIKNIVGDIVGEVRLGAGDDEFLQYGVVANDRIDGGAGADIIETGRGFDVVDGGADRDTLVLPGTRADYSILQSDGGAYLVGENSAVFARNVERVAFTNANVGFSELLGSAPAFDGLRYIAGHGDLRAAFGTDAAAGVAHYVAYGFAEGRDAKAFDPLAYIASYGDLRQALGADADAGSRHFIQYGAAEGRQASFDGLAYIASYGDLIRALGSDAEAGARHFIQYGAGEGRFTAFDALSYGASNTDLARDIGDDPDALARHYIEQGFVQNRPTTGFDSVAYLLSYDDLQAARLGPVGATHHYLQYGADEGRSPSGFYGIEQTSHGLVADAVNRGTFETGTDRDWFATYAQGGQRIEFSVSSVNPISLELHSSDGTTVATATITGNGNAHFDHVSSTADLYFLSVDNMSGQAGSYAFDYHTL